MSKIPARTGNEDPATSQRTEVISNRQTKPVAAAAGSFSRKIPGPKKAGQDVAGEANFVKVTTRDAEGSLPAGVKQTWKGPEDGYTTRSIPDHKPSPAKDTFQDTKPLSTGNKPTNNGEYTGRNVTLNGSLKPYKDGPHQSVKGKRPPRTDGEAKPVAGQHNQLS